MSTNQQDNNIEDHLVKQMSTFNPAFYIWVCLLLGVALSALCAWIYQLKNGLAVTGLSRPVFWGFYIINFVFFIGVSHAGTLISAILRICKAEWRRPITRAAETITVLVLFFGAANIIIDLGRPDRVLNVILYPDLHSPLLWDVISVTTYLSCSIFYLYCPLIPDIAILRDRFPKRKWLYGPLSLGWTGTPKEWRVLNRVIGILAIVVIPVAVSVHTVVSWVFAMTIQPMWHSTIFGPYFVVGAIYSGIASLLTIMVILRKVYHLEGYLKEVHFDYLGRLLLVFTLLWFYFTFAEYLTTFYGNEPVETNIFWLKLTGKYAFYFWTMFVCCFLAPLILLSTKKMRTIKGVLIASILINIGMWLERFLIVVPTLVSPRFKYLKGIYHPTWVEFTILAGCVAAFSLLYMLFAKLFPILSIWEIKEGKEEGIKETVERLHTYLPE